jgi:hypothetical protein
MESLRKFLLKDIHLIDGRVKKELNTCAAQGHRCLKANPCDSHHRQGWTVSHHSWCSPELIFMWFLKNLSNCFSSARYPPLYHLWFSLVQKTLLTPLSTSNLNTASLSKPDINLTNWTIKRWNTDSLLDMRKNWLNELTNFQSWKWHEHK